MREQGFARLVPGLNPYPYPRTQMGTHSNGDGPVWCVLVVRSRFPDAMCTSWRVRVCSSLTHVLGFKYTAPQNLSSSALQEPSTDPTHRLVRVRLPWGGQPHQRE